MTTVANISPVGPPLTKQIPTVADLMKDHDAALLNDQLTILLNQEPHPSWIKSHPFISVKDDKGNDVPLKYLPIEKVEFLLTYIFQRWSVEIINSGSIFNSVFVHVRLKVWNPLTGEWMCNDGIGAAPIQVDKGGSAADLSKIKSSAVMMGLPSAESYATKDAAEKFGRVFGKDLNRQHIVNINSFNNLADRWQKTPE